MRKLVFVCGMALLAASTAVAGTATFSGTARDTEAQLTGDILVYLSDSMDSNCADGCDWGALTTNLTTLCGGPKTLPQFGTFTIVFVEPMWNWTSWWGSWLTLELRDGSNALVATLGIAPPFTWSSYPTEWLYGSIGTVELKWTGEQTGVDSACWATATGSQNDNEPCLDGQRPVAMRISSNGTTLTFSVSSNGVTFTPLPGGTWTIASMPGGLGDMTAVPLSLEIKSCSDITAIDKIEWTASSVPDLNQGPCPQRKFEDLLAYFQAPVGWPTFDSEDFSGPDHDWDGIPDPYELALLATAMCNDPAVQAQFDANLVVAEGLMGPPDYWGWGSGLPSAVEIAAHAMWDPGKMAINWYYWVFDPPASQLVALPDLAADGDLDGDGYSNLEEYLYIAAKGGSVYNYAYAASGGFAGPGVPVAGIIGLVLTAGACAFGGAVSIRRRK